MSTRGSFIHTGSYRPPSSRANDPDMLVVQTGSLSIGIEQIREAIHFLTIRPMAGAEKTVVVLEAEKMTAEAQNAFLKTLEEPPERTTIILATSYPETLLPTVVSRCQIVTDPAREKTSVDKETRDLLVQVKGGSAGERLVLAANVSLERQEALRWLDKALVICHQELKNDSSWAKFAADLFAARKYLQAKTNVRLTIENLFLNW